MNKAFETALQYIGTKEHTQTGEHNPKIVEMFATIGHSWVKDDETAWCAAFVNFCLLVNNFEHTGELNARSFLKYAKKVEEPQIGDIVVFWRSSRNSWKGHVGFYVSEDEENIYCLGGNQSNSVNVTAYKKYRLLGYRRFLVEAKNNFEISIELTAANRKIKELEAELKAAIKKERIVMGLAKALYDKTTM